jgi:hypothetical protein
MAKEKKPVQDDVRKDLPLDEGTWKETPVVVDVAADAKKAVVHDDEVAAIKDSRKRDLPLFAVTKDDCKMWIVAVSDHQAKLAIIDRVYPMEKVSKKDRDYRYLHLLESAAETTKE